MAESETVSKGYPYVSANVWAELRSRFQKSVPTKVTISYLQSALSFGEKAAKNLLPQLRTIGLVDSDGTPTELAKRYRLDAEYPNAVKEIISALYPTEVRELFPGPEEDAAAVANWFMGHTGSGQATAGAQARFYLQLASTEVPTTGGTRKVNTDSARKPSTPRAKRPQAATNGASDRSEEPPVRPADSSPEDGKPPTNQRPNLHIDVQVHIAADASTEQIDAVFASMAKHLYGTDQS